jgi:hypothetical protein
MDPEVTAPNAPPLGEAHASVGLKARLNPDRVNPGTPPRTLSRGRVGGPLPLRAPPRDALKANERLCHSIEAGGQFGGVARRLHTSDPV